MEGWRGGGGGGAFRGGGGGGGIKACCLFDASTAFLRPKHLLQRQHARHRSNNPPSTDAMTMTITLFYRISDERVMKVHLRSSYQWRRLCFDSRKIHCRMFRLDQCRKEYHR